MTCAEIVETSYQIANSGIDFPLQERYGEHFVRACVTGGRERSETITSDLDASGLFQWHKLQIVTHLRRPLNTVYTVLTP